MTGAVLSEPFAAEEQSPSIQTEAVEILQRVKQSLSKVLSRVPGGVKRPMDLQHAVGEDYKICWQIFQFVQAENSLAASHHIPSVVSMKKFFAACETHGVPAPIVAIANDAMESFNKMVASYADDRAAFDTIIATVSGEGSASLSILHRRKAFKSESLLWGVETGVTLSQLYIRYSVEEGCYHLCYVTLKHELRRLRPNVMPVVHGWRSVHSATPTENQPMQPLEPSSVESFGAPLLSKFCSQPPPRLLSVPAANGWVYSLLQSTELGRKGSTTIAFSGFSKQNSAPPNVGAAVGLLNTQITMPTKLVVLEVFVHRPSLSAADPLFESRLMGPGMGPGEGILPEVLRAARHLNMDEELESLGAVPEMRTVKAIPRHAEMVEHIFTRLGWDSAEFDAFRVQVDHPMLHSELEMHAVKT